jgi:hypothetical protein
MERAQNDNCGRMFHIPERCANQYQKPSFTLSLTFPSCHDIEDYPIFLTPSALQRFNVDHADPISPYFIDD